jgi:hypothetical protein
MMRETDYWMLGKDEGEEAGAKDWKVTWTKFSGWYVHYHDCGDSFASVYLCQNLSNCTL